MIPQLDHDFLRLLLSLSERLVSPPQVVLEHLLLAPQKLLPPKPVLLRPGPHLSVPGFHLGERRFLSLIALCLLLVALRPTGLDLAELRGRRLLPCDRHLLPFDSGLLPCDRGLLLPPLHFYTRPRLSDRGLGALAARGAFGDYCRQFLPGHEAKSARGDRTRRAQIGEILQRVSVVSMTFTLAPVEREDPRILDLYADFIRESDGPLVYDREEAGIDIDAEIAAGPPADLVPPGGVFLLALADGKPAGFGGVRYLDTEIAEVKSMYVSPAHRGSGLGRLILARLDEIALEHGCRAVRLDTSDYLTPAVGLYRSAGYREVPAYNENPKADLWFERSLEEN